MLAFILLLIDFSWIKYHICRQILKLGSVTGIGNVFIQWKFSALEYIWYFNLRSRIKQLIVAIFGIILFVFVYKQFQSAVFSAAKCSLIWKINKLVAIWVSNHVVVFTNTRAFSRHVWAVHSCGGSFLEKSMDFPT